MILYGWYTGEEWIVLMAKRDANRSVSRKSVVRWCLPYDSKFSTGRHLFGACYKQNRREMNKLPDPQWKKTNGKVEIWEEQSPQPAEFDLKPLKNDEFYTTTVVLLPCLRGKNRRLRGQDVIWSTSWHPTESKFMGAQTMTSSGASATTSSGEISLKIWKKGDYH